MMNDGTSQADELEAGFAAVAAKVSAMKTAPGVLEASLAALTRQAKMHDQPGGERSMARIVASFNGMFGTSLTEMQGWFFMVLLKMARATTPGKTGIHIDDFVDGASYFSLASEAKPPSEMDRMVAAVKRDIGQ